MPDLGHYEMTVLLAWGGTLLALAGLIGQTLWRASEVRRALQAQEARSQSDRATERATERAADRATEQAGGNG